MEENEILMRVKNVVSKVLKIEPSEITDDANFVFDLGADSMQSVELVAGFEEEFEIIVPSSLCSDVNGGSGGTGPFPHNEYKGGCAEGV